MNQKKQTILSNAAQAIDWAAIHLRMDKMRESLERGLVPTEEDKKNILKARAKILGHESTKRETADESLEVVTFLLANETYGIESSFVREAYPLKDLTPLPCTPGYVYGIVNVRGQILSVIDIKKLFDLPEKGLTDLNKVIVLQNDFMELGLLADAMVGVRSVPVREIEPSLPTLTGIRSEYLKGVTQDRLIILDAGKFLSDKNLIVHEEVGS